MINNIITRDWAISMKQKTGKEAVNNVSDKYCPMCMLKKKERKVQTKEHLWAGECVATKSIMQKWQESIQGICAKHEIQIGATNEIIQEINKEMESVNTSEHSLENHGKAAVLCGMWNNNTLLNIKAILIEEGWEPGKAMGCAMEMMDMMQSIALIIMERIKLNKDLFLKDITPDEWTEMENVSKKKEEEIVYNRVKAIMWDKWNMIRNENGIKFDSWEGKAYITDCAKEKGITEAEVKVDVCMARGTKKMAITKEIKRYKRWREEPEEALKKEVLGRKGGKKKFKKDNSIYEQLETMVINKPELGKKVRGWIRKAKELQESGEVDYWLRIRKQRLEKGKAIIANLETKSPVGEEKAQGTMFPTLAPTGQSKQN